MPHVSKAGYLQRVLDQILRTPLRLYVVSILVAVLPIGLFFYYADRVLRQQTEKQTLQGNMQMASLSALFIEDHFRQSINFLQSYATDPKFQQEWANRNLAWIQEQMNQAHELQPDTALVSTYPPDGTMNTIAPMDPSVIGRNFAFRDWYKGVVKEWKPYVSEVYRTGAAPHVLAVAVSVPIKDAQGKPAGIIAAAYSLERISQWLGQVHNYGARQISVVDQNGRLLAAPGIDVLKPPVDLSRYEPVRRVSNGEANAGLFRRENGDTYVAYVPIPSLRWGVLVEEPAEIVRAQIWDVRQHVAVLGTLFMVLAMVGGAIVSALHRKQQQLSKRMEVLAASEANYRSLIEGALYGIYRIDLDHGFISVNPAMVRMLGYASEEELLQVRDIAREIYWNPEDRARILQNLRKQQRAEGVEVVFRRKDGTPITVRFSGRVVRDSDGNLNFEGIVEDVTVRRRLEQQVLHSEKMAALGRLVAGTAHEINNPLTAILGYADLVAADPTLSEEARQYADKIRQQVRRTKTITNNLLSFARQAPGEKKRPVDINSMVENAFRLQNLNFGLAKIEFHHQLEPNLPHIMGNEYQLLEVCMHILNNSADALLEAGGGIVYVRTRKDGDCVVVEFGDSGPGIGDPARVFDPFYTTKPLGKGAGLGLSASYGIVTEHSGSIRCYNQPEGGATVEIKFPIAQPSEISVPLGSKV